MLLIYSSCIILRHWKLSLSIRNIDYTPLCHRVPALRPGCCWSHLHLYEIASFLPSKVIFCDVWPDAEGKWQLLPIMQIYCVFLTTPCSVQRHILRHPMRSISKIHTVLNYGTARETWKAHLNSPCERALFLAAVWTAPPDGCGKQHPYVRAIEMGRTNG